MSIVVAHYNYWIVILLMMLGFYIVIAQGNLIKKLVGLNLFQTSVFLMYISLAKVRGGTAPIFDDRFEVFSNPLPHVLILTAIVVGVATTSVALALVVHAGVTLPLLIRFVAFPQQNLLLLVYKLSKCSFGQFCGPYQWPALLLQGSTMGPLQKHN